MKTESFAKNEKKYGGEVEKMKIRVFIFISIIIIIVFVSQYDTWQRTGARDSLLHVWD